ncbi:hypothetical protein [Azotobacter chroococcum]|nr:hypothetical protein [Azotobacter chroococcum]
MHMQHVNEGDSCLETREEKETDKRSRWEAVFTRCLEVGMVLAYGAAFLGLLF